MSFVALYAVAGVLVGLGFAIGLKHDLARKFPNVVADLTDHALLGMIALAAAVIWPAVLIVVVFALLVRVISLLLVHALPQQKPKP